MPNVPSVAAPVLVISGPVGVGKTTVGRLIAREFDPSVHVRLDEFLAFFVRGWIEPSLPESAHQNDVVGAAIAAATLRFAEGNYTVVLDGHFFPDAIDELAETFGARSTPLHYAVLRADLPTCLSRAAERRLDTEDFGFDESAVAQLHARFSDIGAYESHVVDARPASDHVAAEVLAAFRAGRLAVAP